MSNKKVVGVSPHIRTKLTMESTMYDVVLALAPVIIMSIVIYGFRVMLLLITAIIFAVLTEAVSSKLFGIENQCLDGSGIVTALLFTLTLPVTVPYKVVAFGSAMSILVGKMLFGGVGKNIFNPALVGRLIVMISYPQYVYNYTQIDGEGGASIFPLIKYTGTDFVYEMFGGKAMFLRGLLYGNDQIIRSMGEVSFVAIVLGAIYLKLKGHIKLKVPIVMLLSLTLMYAITGESPAIYLLGGGVCFAAVYMVTDMATSPYTNVGVVIFSSFIGFMTFFIRKYTSQPEGVTYAILLANIFVPTINKYTMPRSFGGKYNMKKIGISIATLISIFLLSFTIIRVDEMIEDYKLNKQAEESAKELEYLFGKGFESGELSEAIMSEEGYYFQPVNKDGELAGHIVVFESKGYSTEMVKIVMGLNLEGAITGLKVLEQNETLGLGSQIQSEEWQSLWRERDLTYEFDKSVDAYTGATFTFLNAYKEIMTVLESYEFVLLDIDFGDFEEFDSEEFEDEGFEEESFVEKEFSDEGFVENESEEKTGDK